MGGDQGTSACSQAPPVKSDHLSTLRDFCSFVRGTLGARILVLREQPVLITK